MSATTSCSAIMPAIDSSETTNEAPLSPMPRPRLCRPTRASAVDVLLPFGQRSDGAIVHVSAVERGLACDCVCPGCGGRLVAHKGERKEHHFQHHSSAPCVGAFETALHKLAKQILDRELRLTLPMVGYGEGDDRVIESLGGVFEFDRAELEVPFAGFQPDVVLYRGERRLLVEVLVTHETDLAKQERIAATGLSAVEIDLSNLPRDADIDQVTDALCRTAPRWWLHNERLARARARWEMQQAEKARIAAEAAERSRQIREKELDGAATRLRRVLAIPPSARALNPHAATLEEAGLEPFVDRAIAGEAAFAVPRSVWQSAVLDAVILKQLQQHPYAWGQSGTHPLELFRNGPLNSMVKRGIPASQVDADALVERVPGFVRPYDAVISYFDYLASEGLIIEGRNKRWTVSESTIEVVGERQAAARRRRDRRAELGELVNAIMAALPEDEREGFVLADWLRRPLRPSGQLPANALFRDKEGTALLVAIRALNAMLTGSGLLCEEELGLPVHRARLRVIDVRRRAAEQAAAERRAREAEAAQRAAETERKAAAGRVEHLQWRADKDLVTDAVKWLAAPIDSEGGLTASELAARDDAGLVRALDRLAAAAETRAKALQTAELRERLRRLGRESIKPDHAHAFLNSGQPRWQGKRPIDFCTDATSFELVVKLMREAMR